MRSARLWRKCMVATSWCFAFFQCVAGHRPYRVGLLLLFHVELFALALRSDHRYRATAVAGFLALTVAGIPQTDTISRNGAPAYFVLGFCLSCRRPAGNESGTNAKQLVLFRSRHQALRISVLRLSFASHEQNAAPLLPIGYIQTHH